MKTIESTPGRFAFLAVLICTLLLWCLIAPGVAFADDPPTAPPPPPTRTPVPTPEDPTNTPEPTDTPEPTNTLVPTNTPKTPPPTATPTPSNTPWPTQTPSPTASPPGPVVTSGPGSTARPNPDCQSVVTGRVFEPSGAPAPGATVLIEGTDWSRAMATNDQGQYGFSQLCPGKASLQAFLADGRVSQLAELDLTGRDNIQVELDVTSAAAATTGASTPQQTATPGPDMPATGNAGWLLLGAALLAVFLLLVAGTRRAMTVREHTEEHD